MVLKLNVTATFVFKVCKGFNNYWPAKKEERFKKPVAFLKLHPKDQEKGNNAFSYKAAVAV